MSLFNIILNIRLMGKERKLLCGFRRTAFRWVNQEVFWPGAFINIKWESGVTQVVYSEQFNWFLVWSKIKQIM